jgi:hypothetical protein
MPWASKDMIFCMTEPMCVYRGGNWQTMAIVKSDHRYEQRQAKREAILLIK